MKPQNYLLPLLLFALPFARADAQVNDRFSELRRQTETYQKSPDQNQRKAIELQCMQVVGMPSFCSCLSNKLPDGLSFDHYVVVLTRTKKDNGYDRLPASAKKTYDSIPDTRDACTHVSVAAP